MPASEVRPESSAIEKLKRLTAAREKALTELSEVADSDPYRAGQLEEVIHEIDFMAGSIQAGQLAQH